MKPETIALLDAARAHVDEAQAVPGIRLWGLAGRSAYMAALVAGRAYILETTGSVVKTHRGTHNSFYRLAAGDPRFDDESRRFLSRAYGLKDATDDGVGLERAVPEERARAALTTAIRFVARAAEILAAPPSP